MKNPFYEASINHMSDQLAYIEKLLGRPLTDDEKDNIHEVYDRLHPRSREDFEDKFGPLL